MSAQVDHGLAEKLILSRVREGLSQISFGLYPTAANLASSYSSLRVDYGTTNTGPSF